jgi:hypothetical protein
MSLREHFRKRRCLRALGEQKEELRLQRALRGCSRGGWRDWGVGRRAGLRRSDGRQATRRGGREGERLAEDDPSCLLNRWLKPIASRAVMLKIDRARARRTSVDSWSTGQGRKANNRLTSAVSTTVDFQFAAIGLRCLGSFMLHRILRTSRASFARFHLDPSSSAYLLYFYRPHVANTRSLTVLFQRTRHCASGHNC